LFWSVLFGVGAAIPLVCVAVDVLVPSAFRLIGRDFAGFWAAGRLAAHGHAEAAYNGASIAEVIRPLATITFGFIYPPQTLALLAPFGLLPYYAALAAWTIFGSVVFVMAARPFLPFNPWLAILTPAALLNIWDGNFGLVFGALWLLSFSPARQVAGISAGLSTFKPHLAVMLLPRFLIERRAIPWGVGATAVSSLLFLPLWPAFLGALGPKADYVATANANSLFLRMMPGAYAVFGRSWLAHSLFAAGTILVLARYRTIDPFTLATATFLILPYGHNYDMTVACLGPAIMLRAEWSTLKTVEKTVLSGAYLAPALTFVVPYAVPPILLVCLVVQSRHRHNGTVTQMHTDAHPRQI
jgi:hypothetical protein